MYSAHIYAGFECLSCKHIDVDTPAVGVVPALPLEEQVPAPIDIPYLILRCGQDLVVENHALCPSECSLAGLHASDAGAVGAEVNFLHVQAVSASPVEVESLQITKSVNGEPGEKRASDTMGMKHFVRFGLYEVKGSINVRLAEKTGFSQEDAQVLKECLRTLFVNDASSARPEGSMEVVKLYWWQHNCKDGQYSSAKVHRSVHVMAKNTAAIPNSIEDYTITLDELPGLMPEIIEGM